MQLQNEQITLLVFSGRRIPAVVFDGGVIFSTKTRFRSGIKRLAISLREERVSRMKTVEKSTRVFGLGKELGKG